MFSTQHICAMPVSSSKTQQFNESMCNNSREYSLNAYFLT